MKFVICMNSDAETSGARVARSHMTEPCGTQFSICYSHIFLTLCFVLVAVRKTSGSTSNLLSNEITSK